MASRSHLLALRILRPVDIALLRLLLDFRLAGPGRLPTEGPAVVCPNHASLLDPLVVQAGTERPLAFVMNARIHRRPALRWLYRIFETIPISAATSREALVLAGRALAGGELVVIFPEGGLSLDGRLGRFRSGAAVLALRHGVPIVPVRIEGTSVALPRGGRWVRPARVRMHVGAPLAVPRTPEPFPKGAPRELIRRVRDAVAALGPGAA